MLFHVASVKWNKPYSSIKKFINRPRKIKGTEVHLNINFDYLTAVTSTYEIIKPGDWRLLI